MGIFKSFTCVALAVAILAISGGTASAALSDFETGIYWSSANYDLYWAFYDPFKGTTAPAGESYPLLIYLHGSGNAGRDISGPATHPNASMLLGHAKKAETRAFVLIPQCHTSWSATGAAGVALKELITNFAADHPIDMDRIYMTGFSLGGLGVFSFESNSPEFVAAGCPMAGALWESDNATKQANRASVATWAFSGAIDGTVPPADALEALEAQTPYGPDPLFTIYSSTGHNDTWQKVNALDQNALISWMYAQENNQPQDMSMFVGWPINETETLILDGSGDSITRDLDYFAGYYGRGDLSILDGAVVTSRNGVVAAQGGSRGNVIIDGAGSAWNCDTKLAVGENNGVGSLHIANGASVSGDYLTINEFSYLSGNGTINADDVVCDGTLSPGDVSTLVEQTATVTYGGRLVTAAASAVSNTELNEELYALTNAGDETGVLTISGGLRFDENSVVVIQLAGTASGEFDAVIAGSPINLDGELVLSLVGDYKPNDGDTFDILVGSSITSSFTKITGSYSTNGTTLITSYLSDRVRLTADVRKPGDANGSETVNMTDFIILKQNYGKTDATWNQGDFNGDGVVNIDDFIILKQNYGT